MASSAVDIETFPQWRPQPKAARLIEQTLRQYCDRCSVASELATVLRRQTGTRLIDWIDHLAVPGEEGTEPRLRQSGFLPEEPGSGAVWRHAEGLFPAMEVSQQGTWRAAIKVDSVDDFLAAHRLHGPRAVEGRALGPLRKARIAHQRNAELWAVERRGWRGWQPPDVSSNQAAAARRHTGAFQRRNRDFRQDQAGFDHALALIRAAVDDLGVDWACDLFFAAERRYWTRRNRAARRQKARQDKLGLGWGNHDHHTYRSSRSHFATLIATLEELGLECRERFYAGKEAGWGAQVIEQPQASIVVFADVDLAPHEVAGDFAHKALAPSPQLGTVGLWCRLHGEAFLQSGMHHLECQFDFHAARSQLRLAGINQMAPFTNLPYLKQAFTEGETWPVDPSRIVAALAADQITPQQAERFRRSGAIGSHLEILERNEGYKGFNQAGINEIIRDTDPRRTTSTS